MAVIAFESTILKTGQPELVTGQTGWSDKPGYQTGQITRMEGQFVLVRYKLALTGWPVLTCVGGVQTHGGGFSGGFGGKGCFPPKTAPLAIKPTLPLNPKSQQNN